MKDNPTQPNIDAVDNSDLKQPIEKDYEPIERIDKQYESNDKINDGSESYKIQPDDRIAEFNAEDNANNTNPIDPNDYKGNGSSPNPFPPSDTNAAAKSMPVEPQITIQPEEQKPNFGEQKIN